MRSTGKLVDEQHQELESAQAAERTGHAAVKTARAQAATAVAKVLEAKADVAEARAAVRVGRGAAGTGQGPGRLHPDHRPVRRRGHPADLPPRGLHPLGRRRRPGAAARR